MVAAPVGSVDHVDIISREHLGSRSIRRYCQLRKVTGQLTRRLKIQIRFFRAPTSLFWKDGEYENKRNKTYISAIPNTPREQ